MSNENKSNCGGSNNSTSAIPTAQTSQDGQHPTSPSEYNLDAVLSGRMHFVTDCYDEIPCEESVHNCYKGYLSRSKKHAFIRRRRTVSFNLDSLTVDENRVPLKTACGDRTSLKRKPSGLAGRGQAKQAATNLGPHDFSPRLQAKSTEKESNPSDTESEQGANFADLPLAEVFPRRAATPRQFVPVDADFNCSGESSRNISGEATLKLSSTLSSPRRARRPVAHKRSKRPLAEGDDEAVDEQSDSSGIFNNNAGDYPVADRVHVSRPTVTAAKKVKSSKVHITEDYLVQHLRDIAITNDSSGKNRLTQPSISDSLAGMLNASLGIAQIRAAAGPAFLSHAVNNLFSSPCNNTANDVSIVNFAACRKDCARENDDDAIIRSNFDLATQRDIILPANGYDADDEEDHISRLFDSQIYNRRSSSIGEMPDSGKRFLSRKNLNRYGGFAVGAIRSRSENQQSEILQ